MIMYLLLGLHTPGNSMKVFLIPIFLLTNTIYGVNKKSKLDIHLSNRESMTSSVIQGTGTVEFEDGLMMGVC